MSISNFNITDIRMSDVQFNIENRDFIGDIQLETSMESHYALADDGNNSAKLKLIISVFPTEKDAPFRVKVTMEGIFSWTDEIPEEELAMYLRVNGNAVLYSYARPIISQLTTFAGFSSLVLPLNNFMED